MNNQPYYPDLIGASDAMLKIFRKMEQVSVLDVPVLLSGESGTGKDLIARQIHLLSDKRTGPFIPVNMGAISPELIESELFGHEKGAFTGAGKLHKGKFELANDGTLFLDEITTTEQKVQVSLLRVMESMQFQRVGGSKFISTNTRVISATNENILQCVEQGSFREDLFYRLNVFPITVPPLRERGEDILLLAENFLKQYSEEFNKKPIRFSQDSKKFMMKYPWPGNVRELENAVIRALIMTSGEEIPKKYFPKRRRDKNAMEFSIEIGTSLEDTERKLILETLKHTDGNKLKAAKMLRISRKSLYNKIDNYNLNPIS